MLPCSAPQPGAVVPSSQSPLWETTRVPEGHIWALGDNPNNSNDSRVFGPVPLGLVHGRIVYRVWPPSRFGGLDPPPPNVQHVLDAAQALQRQHERQSDALQELQRHLESIREARAVVYVDERTGHVVPSASSDAADDDDRSPASVVAQPEKDGSHSVLAREPAHRNESDDERHPSGGAGAGLGAATSGAHLPPLQPKSVCVV